MSDQRALCDRCAAASQELGSYVEPAPVLVEPSGWEPDEYEVGVYATLRKLRSTAMIQQAQEAIAARCRRGYHARAKEGTS